MKILSFDCHESLLTAWAMLGHEIHLLPYIQEWAWNISKRPIPANIKLLPEGYQPDFKSYDLGVAFNEHTQAPIVRTWGIPYLISFASLANIQNPSACRGERLVFCAYSQRQHYQDKYGPDNFQGPVVYYPVDLDEFKGYIGGPTIVSMINYFGQKNNRAPRGYDWAYQITKGLHYENFGHSLPGDVIQFRTPINYENLKSLYQKHGIYLDPVIASPMSMANLEAMATGMPLVTRRHDDWPLIIQDGINGVISSDDEYIRNHIMGLLVAPDERLRIGKNARETMREMFSVQAWKDNWNKIFQEMGVL